MIIAGFLGAFVFLCPVVLIHDLTVAAVCLSLAFFFAELIVAPIWSVPMDIAPRYAGSASGMMNFGFGVAGLVSPSSFGYLVDRTGSWVFPFIVLDRCCCCSARCWPAACGPTSLSWTRLLQAQFQRPHSCLLASAAPADNARSLAQANCGWMRPPIPQSVPAITFSRPTASA